MMLIRSLILANFIAVAVAASGTPASFLVDTHGANKYLAGGQTDADARHNRRLDELITDASESRRTLARFTKGDVENELCWDRKGVDGFLSVIDAHNHYHAFEGQNVPYDEYADWMIEHGILFSVIIGLGQRIVKTNADDPNCCYYLHCPTLNYTVTPSTKSDILNAEWYTSGYANYTDRLHLVLSTTYANLQVPGNNSAELDALEAQFPGAFGWVGEVNLMKHALAANGFFENPTVTEANITTEGSPLNDFFSRIATNGWPTTIHADLGCDNFNSVPGWEGRCIIEDPDLAVANAAWYKDVLGVHYPAFFDEADDGSVTPKPNFRKIQYLKLFDTVLTTFPELKVIWAHEGLSKELLGLHPAVHSTIMETLFDRHPNLYTDMSWDIIPQLYLMNYDAANDSIEKYKAQIHEDITPDSEINFDWDNIEQLRVELAKRWDHHEDKVEMFGSAAKINGPTHAMAIYYKVIHAYPDRFLTGTDFVASLGPAEEWPGLAEFKSPPTGCMKDKANHARQLTDTSSINIMLDDEAFRKIVLGENYFKITGLSDKFQAPPLCTSSDTSSDTSGGGAPLKQLFMSSMLAIGAIAGYFGW